jgi:hypothetical protein
MDQQHQTDLANSLQPSKPKLALRRPLPDGHGRPEVMVSRENAPPVK